MFLQHLQIDSSCVTPYVLLPGDPGRVEKIGQNLDSFEIIQSTREFTIGTGIFEGLPVMVVSTGIGCPSTAIVVEELIEAGAKCLIRVGTCGGSWRADVPAGSLVIPTASIRDEGTTAEYIPPGFPAVADYLVVQKLQESAESLKKEFFIGINRTHDAFYGSQQAITRWGKYLEDECWQKADTPILSSEMESSALFVIAALRGVKAGAVFAVNATPEPLLDRLKGRKQKVVAQVDPHLSAAVVGASIQVALKAVVSLEQQLQLFNKT